MWDQGSSHSHTKRLHACICVCVCVYGTYMSAYYWLGISVLWKKSFFSILSKDLVEWDFFFEGKLEKS